MGARYGQHFLIDESVIDQELALANLKPDDVVLEVGPGKGALTKRLAEQVKEVIAVEVDRFLIKSLESEIPGNVKLIEGDIVKLGLETLPKFNKVVTNLPYQISSPFTFQLLKYPFERAAIIYQLDFALRMTAEPWMYDYSRLSVGVYYYSECELIRKIPPGAFRPQPRVDSALVTLLPRSKPAFEVKDEEFFFDIVRVLFNHRRKTVRAVLKNHLKSIDEDLPFLSLRVEEMSPEEIGLLSNLLFEAQ